MSFSFVDIILVMMFSGIELTSKVFLIFYPIFFLFLFCSGVGMILSALSVYFRDINHLWGVLTLAWTYATPIFYPISGVDPAIQSIIRINPLFHYIDMFRSFIMYNAIPELTSWLICAFTGIAMLVLGLFIFGRMQKNFILYM